MWERAVRTTVVVLIDEVVEQLLELGNCGCLSRLGAEPLLEGLLEAFDLVLGVRVVRSAVLLNDLELAKPRLEAVTPASPARSCR